MVNSKAPPITSAVANIVSLGNGMWIDVDAAGNTTIFSKTGLPYLEVGSDGTFTVSNQFGSKLVFSGATATFTKVNGNNVVGQGTPIIVATSVQNQTNAAPTTVSFTPPAAAGTYRISSFLDISTGTTITFKNILGYTDANGSAQTDIPVWQRQNSATMLAAPTANTADRFVQLGYPFSIDNSATAITLGDNTGTYTTCVYRYTVLLEQLI